jgi:transcriptional regulator with XRE-family HTH domain
MGTHAVQRDATAETVSANVKRLRTDQNLGLRGLSTKLAEVGRPLGHSAVDQIEKGTRRVDVDDLVALAAALGVSPTTLLMPGMSNADAPKMIEVARAEMSIARFWLWLKTDAALPTYQREQRRFYLDARPEWDPGPGDPRLWIKETIDGDD